MPTGPAPDPLLRTRPEQAEGTERSLPGRSSARRPCSLGLPDGDLPLLSAGPAQHVSVLRRAQGPHGVCVGHQLLFHRPPLGIDHVDLPFGFPLRQPRAAHPDLPETRASAHSPARKGPLSVCGECPTHQMVEGLPQSIPSLQSRAGRRPRLTCLFTLIMQLTW